MNAQYADSKAFSHSLLAEVGWDVFHIQCKFLFPSCFLAGYGFGVSNSTSARAVDADGSYVGQ